MKRLTKVVMGLLMVAYPVVVYFGLTAFSLKQLALFLIALFVIRFFVLSNGDQERPQSRKEITKSLSYIGGMVGVLLVGCVFLFEQDVFLRLYPVFINLLLLLGFAWTLLNPPSAIEIIARKMEPDLSDLGVYHTRQFTWVWCVFFVVNGGVAAYTALFASLEAWTFYNGFLAYLLMGALLGIEYLVRVIRKKRAGEM